MKLTKKELTKLSSSYNLGKITSVKYIPEGMINYNFFVKTEKGDYVVRRLGYKEKGWHMDKKELQMEVIEYLRKKKFPYEIPHFLKNKKGEFISKIDGNLFEVYKKIQGKNIVKLNDKKFEKMVKALAIYHKTIKDFPLKKKFRKLDDYKWMLKKYSKIKEIKPKNKLDKLMLKHLDFFENLLKKLLKFDIRQNLLVTHSDFSKWNLLWKGEELVGIIDFENLGYKPKVFDIAYMWREEDKKKLIVDTYRKYNFLSKKEEKNMIVYRLLNSCNLFWWSYFGMKKRPELRYKWILRTIRGAKKFEKLLK